MYTKRARAISICKKCGKSLIGRSDGKFCSDKCRVWFNNHKPKTDEKRKQLAENTRKWYSVTKSTEPERFMWFRIRQRARIKKIPFNIDVNDIVIPKKCPLLGIDLFFSNNIKHPTPNTPSLDRREPKLGYVKGNVWVISYKANIMKQDIQLETLKTFARNIINNF